MVTQEIVEDDGRALRDAITHIIFMAYIGQSASRTKAERTADKVIEMLLVHYAGMAGEAEAP